MRTPGFITVNAEAPLGNSDIKPKIIEHWINVEYIVRYHESPINRDMCYIYMDGDSRPIIVNAGIKQLTDLLDN